MAPSNNDAIELLAGGIAHDFDALLSTIATHADNLSDYIAAGDPRAADVAAIREAAETAAALTRQLLAFSRTQALLPTIVDLNAVVSRSQHSLRRLLGERIALTTRLSPELLRVRADPEQLEHILRSLAVNARDAMPAGGTLTITAGNAVLGEDEARRRDVEPGRYVELEVSDTGVGMEPTVQAHLFEPFFTTKQRVRGTGLGLAMVHGVVRQSGGCISVESEIGRGSRFVMYLPATDHPALATTSTSPAHGAETLMVMGDDGSVQSFISDVLRRRGYELLLAEDQSHALRLADTCGRPIDLLITSGPNGAVVADALCARRPSTRVLYVSSSDADAPVRASGDVHPIAILQKPFSPATLVRKVRAVLQP